MRLGAPLVAGLAFATLSTCAFAEDYPTKPITLIVPYGPGSTTDVLARSLSEVAARRLGQPIIVENKAGAGGIIGTEFVARSDADGYTLVFAANQTHATNVSLYPDLSYDPLVDFTPIAKLVMQPQVLVVNPAVSAETVAALTQLAQSADGALSFASTGIGTGAHLSGELFKLSTGSDIVHVPYNGSDAITALLSGTVDFMFYPYLPLKGHIDSGALRLLASTSEDRVPWLPDTPTMVESGFDGFVMSSWFALYGPANMNPTQVTILSEAYQAALEDPTVAQRLTEGGSINIYGGPDELADFTKSEIARAADIVTRSGAVVE